MSDNYLSNLKRLRFKYILFPLNLVVAVFAAAEHCPPVLLDNALSENFPGFDAEASRAAVHEALADGYRWTRTEGEFAVFELKTFTP